MPCLDSEQPLHWYSSSCLPVCSLRCRQKNFSNVPCVSFPDFKPFIAFRIKPTSPLGLHGLPHRIHKASPHATSCLVYHGWATAISDHIGLYLSCMEFFSTSGSWHRAPSEALLDSSHSCLLLNSSLYHYHSLDRFYLTVPIQSLYLTPHYFIYFWLHMHMEVLGPGIKYEPQQWQCQIFNPLRH